MKNAIIALLGTALAVVRGLYGFMYLGMHDMGADSPVVRNKPVKHMSARRNIRDAGRRVVSVNYKFRRPSN